MVEIIAGDSHSWRLLPTRFIHPKEISPSAKWTAFFQTDKNEEKPIELEVRQQKEFLIIVLSPENSESMSEKSGDVLLRISGQDFRKTFFIENVSIVPLGKSSPASFKSKARLNLEAAQRALETYTSSNGHVRSYTIGTRSMTFNSPQELFDLIEYWKKQVFLEDCRARGIDPHTLLVEFV